MTRFEELDLIAEKNAGVLLPEEIVEYAKDEESELHKSFEWDDTEAGKKYRILQAQDIIRCYVIRIDTEEKSVKARAYQSLPSERGKNHPYRKTTDCLDNDTWRAEMIKTALQEFAALKQKYEILKELGPLWDAINKIAA